nr:MAG TPA: hypothetical protein [Caudoviricetes sp.]
MATGRDMGRNNNTKPCLVSCLWFPYLFRLVYTWERLGSETLVS